jgi:hypothetical protein
LVKLIIDFWLDIDNVSQLFIVHPLTRSVNRSCRMHLGKLLTRLLLILLLKAFLLIYFVFLTHNFHALLLYSILIIFLGFFSYLQIILILILFSILQLLGQLFRWAYLYLLTRYCFLLCNVIDTVFMYLHFFTIVVD